MSTFTARELFAEMEPPSLVRVAEIETSTAARIVADVLTMSCSSEQHARLKISAVNLRDVARELSRRQEVAND